MYNYREQIGMPRLSETLGVMRLKDLEPRKKKAVHNIKWCANDQWGYVNAWYDEHSEDARSFLLDARGLFSTVYTESLKNVYDGGSCCFGDEAEAYLRDIRFCGIKFLSTVALYYTAKLLEEAVPEVEGTAEDSDRVARDLLALKAELDRR